MRFLDIVREMEDRSDLERRLVLLGYMDLFMLPRHRDVLDEEVLTGVFEGFSYKEFKNCSVIIPTDRARSFAVSCHYDAVPRSPGANDNASSCAVVLDLAIDHARVPLDNIGVEFYFFDMEERNLKGSRNFCYGCHALPEGLINLELVGMGDRLAIWPVLPEDDGFLLRSVEYAAHSLDVPLYRFPQLATNDADHTPFREHGVEAYTLSAVSKQDVRVGIEYFHALDAGVTKEQAWNIAKEAPIFEHYHQPTDRSSHLSEDSLRMTRKVVWDALRNIDQSYTGR